MISKELARARGYEEKQTDLITDEMRPAYHFSPRTGWLNDPNGLSYYDGKYHLFYQYHPYSTYWGPMHWGHAVSEDLITWEYLPAALAPDTEYDYSGCFSGSAVTMDDGSHLLMYTSCGDSSGDPTGKGRWIQMQSIAIRKPGESEYAKYEGNPVISADDLPEGGDPYEFRDPYMWRCNDGSYRVLVANGRTSADEGTRLLMFRSEDGLNWGGGKVLFEDERRIGVMWECPNFFPLDGRHILMASPMDMQAEEGDAVGSIRFPQGNNVCYITGDYDEQLEEFYPDADDADAGYFMYEPVDGGLDFYAPQTFETVDGRRVMIGWMQDPSMANVHSEDEFKEHNIRLICSDFASSNVDLPSMPADLYSITDDRSLSVIMDIGGDDRGAYALGRLRDAIKNENDYEMLMVVNKFRPLTPDAESTIEVMREIEWACGIPFTGIINNSNLAGETDAQDVLSSMKYAQEVSELSGLPVVLTTVETHLYDELKDKISPLFRLKLQKKPI